MSKKILTYYSNVCEELESFSKKTIERRELFLIKVESNFQYEAELCSILNAENLDFSPAVIIGPRPGTKSPWSSKTEDRYHTKPVGVFGKWIELPIVVIIPELELSFETRIKS